MDTMSKPLPSHQPAATRSSASQDSLADAAREAVDAVKSTATDAMDRGQAGISHAGQAATHMADTANHQMKTLASELEAMAKRNPLGTIAGAVLIGFFAGYAARGGN